MRENPRAADSTGIPVHQYQWAAVLLNGMLGGLEGAYLVLVQVGNFSENMTSGRGIHSPGGGHIRAGNVPFGMMGAAFIFGAANALFKSASRPSECPCPHRLWPCCLTS
ncbi:MAG: ABC transporter permease subunit [Enterocloster sp.]